MAKKKQSKKSASKPKAVAPAKKVTEPKTAPASPASPNRGEPQARQGGPAELQFGYIRPREIVDEMKESYLDYAMSVIVSRALPDVRDGLKPVHRRILYAMWDIGLRSSAKYRKSATVVGEVLGKYHPHGDIAVYDSLVRMAQTFSLRYPLIDGQGNFGSMDGDSAAAMRYTEVKLEKVADELLTDLERDTVNFTDNYDRAHQEPSVLPANLPNILLNGTMGIAVGMATNIPPHNLGEICDAIIHLIEHPKADVEDLLEYVTGPDFPTGGIAFGKKDIAQAYTTGKGGVVVRAKADIIEDKKGAFKIIVTELPYQVNKAELITKIAALVKDKKIEGIKDIRDESDREGVRVMIELKREAYPKKVLNRLYVLTQLQDKFHYNLLALVDGIQPRVLNLKAILEEYIKHRQRVITRRTAFDLARAKDRAHILEGLKKALDHINEIIALIKKSKNRDDAQKNLMKRFRFSDRQANAILDMKLSQLAALERQKIEDELAEKRKLIRELESILKDPKKVLTMIKADLGVLKEKYGDERRTKIVATGVGEFKEEDMVAREDIIITLTKGGYIKSLPEETYRSQGRGGKGVIGMITKEEDMVDHILSTNTLSDLLFFTNRGRVFQLRAYEIPKSTRVAKGQSIVNFLQLSADEKVTAMIEIDKKDKETRFLAMGTRNGLAKKVALEDFANVRRSGLIAIKLKKGDDLEWVRPTTGNDEFILVTTQGQAIRFSEKSIRAMGRNAAGVRAIRLKKAGDSVVGMDVVKKKPEVTDRLLTITENGFGKTTGLSEYKLQGRGGSGVKTANVTGKNGRVVTAQVVTKEYEGLIIMSKKGQTIRIELTAVPEHGRATQGVRVMRMKPGDSVATVAII